MTAYATFASSLQQGDIAPAGVVNAGHGLAPYRSTEWETGYKVDLSTINFTAALFRLERPFANINTATNVYEITGDQVNYGIELSAIGQIVRSLSVYSGFTILNPNLLIRASPPRTINSSLAFRTTNPMSCLSTGSRRCEVWS
jgi:iron complex outermembrane recepter protein